MSRTDPAIEQLEAELAEAHQRIAELQNKRDSLPLDPARAAAEWRYRALFEYLPIPIFWSTASGKVLSANPAMLRMMRVESEQEWLSFPAEHFYAEPKTRDELMQLLRRDDAVDEFPIRLRREDGSIIEALSTIRLVVDPYAGRHLLVGAVQDITARVQAEAATRASRANLEALIENVRDFVLFSDRQGMPIFFNRAYARVMKALLGLEMKPGIKPHELLPDPEERARWEGFHRRVLAGEHFSVEYEHQVDDGSTIFFEVSYNPVRVDGEVVGFSEFTRDISERKRAEQQSQRLQQRMQEAQRLESLGILAGGIAHDFNNLLLPVLGQTDLALARLAADAPARKPVQAIQRAAQRAAALTSQILTYAGKGTMQLEVRDLAEIVREMQELVKSMTATNATIDYDLEARAQILCDTTQLEQLVMNLICNASDALEGRAGRIQVSVKVSDRSRAELDQCRGGGELTPGPYAVLTVSDSGVGMSADTVERVFDPFFSTKATGRGLGMAATSGITQAHGGAIQVQSSPGQGSSFTFLFPAADRENVVSRRAEPAAQPGWRSRGTVLVVDDDGDIRDVTAAMLEDFGFQAVKAAGGAQAVELFRGRTDIRCVLLDLTMPGMGGHETLAALRDVRGDVPVILSSGYDEAELPCEIEQATAFLRKPYGLEELGQKLRQLLEAG